MSACPYCGWPDDQPALTLSQHRTGEGATVWARCACGSLQARSIVAGVVTVVVRGRPTGWDVPAEPDAGTDAGTEAGARPGPAPGPAPAAASEPATATGRAAGSEPATATGRATATGPAPDAGAERQPPDRGRTWPAGAAGRGPDGAAGRGRDPRDTARC